MTSAVRAMPQDQAGVVAAVASSSRQIGAALGVAILGALAVAGRRPATVRLPDASHAAWWVMAACGAAVAITGLIGSSALRSERRALPNLRGVTTDSDGGCLP